MEILVTQEHGRVPITVMQVAGRINLGNTEALEQKAQEAHSQGVQNLILDLSAVPSITSAGLRSLLFIYKLFNGGALSGGEAGAAGETAGEGEKSPHFKLVNPSPYVQRVLETAGFNRYMDIYPELPAAVAAFQA